MASGETSFCEFMAATCCVGWAAGKDKARWTGEGGPGEEDGTDGKEVREQRLDVARSSSASLPVVGRGGGRSGGRGRWALVVVNGSWDGFGSGEDEQAAGSERASERKHAGQEREAGGRGRGRGRESVREREREREAGLAGLAAGTSGGRALDWEREMGGGSWMDGEGPPGWCLLWGGSWGGDAAVPGSWVLLGGCCGGW